MHEIVTRFSREGDFRPPESRPPPNMTGSARIIIRPYVAKDFKQLRSLFRTISPQARRFRFMAACSEVSDQVLRLLADVDYCMHFALVAEVTNRDGREIVAEARYFGDWGDRSTCEFSITVADQWGGQGLGRELLEQLEHLATANGFSTMRGETFTENRSMVRLAGGSGYRITRDPHEPELSYFEKNLNNLAPLEFVIAHEGAFSAQGVEFSAG